MAVVVCEVNPVAVFPVNQQSTGGGEGSEDGRLDIWNSIQSQKKVVVECPALLPYVHPLLRRSSSSLISQKSLQVCTESLGSETGSDVFSDDDFSPSPFASDLDEIEPLQNFEDEDEEEEVYDEVEKEEEEKKREEKELVSVNYHCCISRRSPVRSFPPPLPSISRRDGPCLSMRPHRRDGRLVVEAVPVPSQNYLHAERHDGRLLLSFIHTSSPQPSLPIPSQIKKQESPPQQQDEDEGEDEEDGEEEQESEEEVEVVDRGTVVEVKVSMQPQQQSGSMKVHRSSLVINKFVGGTPISVEDEQDEPPKLRRVPSTTMTAAAAVVAAASSLSGGDSGCSMENTTADSKLLFTSKGRSKEEMLYLMRRCSELRRPIFFYEPCCIVTN
ncbi:protein FAF-like, chloroplastic [Dioscorea cayenensis subsp. rotundata]|uniref:Protein FAF-like, chloroplastic n=1 Tax=Dioscorea cayennensis subsp. rotundata TaxID=55577 RepID=A0AB40D1H4_DIOCR|nr:protein FAF-like, chloroplastic [Dioscorea cayenensis subsp. rotundata]